MSYEEKKHPQTKLEVIRGGDGGKGKTAVGTSNSGGSPNPSKRRAIVFDKDQTIRRGLSLMLSPFAEVVAEGADGPDAYEAIREHEPDLVLIDMELENCTGLQVLQQFNENVKARFEGQSEGVRLEIRTPAGFLVRIP